MHMPEKHTPLVSVVLPAYNVMPYLTKALDSLQSQTFEDFELICVDDGSSDGSFEILREYAAKDSRMSIMRQQYAGVAVARNRFHVAQPAAAYKRSLKLETTEQKYQQARQKDVQQKTRLAEQKQIRKKHLTHCFRVLKDLNPSWQRKKPGGKN